MKEDIKPFHIWRCVECVEDMSYEEFKKHIVKKHQIKTTSGERQMLMHADGQKHYDYKFQWTIEGHVFTQHIRSLRDKSDMMYHK